jgi:hypothetical protein
MKSAKPPKVKNLDTRISSSRIKSSAITHGADCTFLGYFFKKSAEVVAAVIRVNFPTAPQLTNGIEYAIDRQQQGDSRQLDAANV